jgi:DNA-binding PadR family transcriptional regulator
MKYQVLALLADGPAHGYELKQKLEEAFGSAWPEVNIGQVYATLARLERDGLVSGCHVAQPSRPDKKVYVLSPAGQAELNRWLQAPPEPGRLNHDFFMKLLLARMPGAGIGAAPRAMVERLRLAALQTLRDLNERALGGNPGATETLLLEGAILHLQADIKWLQLYEEQLSQEAT